MNVKTWEVTYDDPDISHGCAVVGYDASEEAVAFGPIRSDAAGARADAQALWPGAVERP